MKKHSAEWLVAKGFSGLFYPGECSCSIEDHNICGEDCVEGCTPGYKHEFAMGRNDVFGEDYCVSKSKVPPTEEELQELI